MNISTIISLVALIFSGLSLLISLWTFKRDRSDLRPSLDYFPTDNAGTSFNIRVVNHGRRVAYVERYIVSFWQGESICDSVAGGEAVSEGKPVDFWLPIYNHQGVLICDPTKLRSLEIFDTLGNLYRYPRLSFSDWGNFIKLKKKIHQDWQIRKDDPNYQEQ